MLSRSDNFKRLLNPRHIAFIGGADADYSARQCAAQFDGPVWGVNPKREYLGGLPCYASVTDLPEAPDAVFLATPRDATIPIIKQLSDMGAGGIACFTAGYGELGESGQKAERELIEAAGNMALVGPNCYGLINYTNGAFLWPFGAGNTRCEKGIAIIMQSGMIPANLTMNDRSVPITYVISAGNQAILTIEDYIDVLVDDPRVTAVGIYIEGIKSIENFAAASIKALKANKPLVVLKAGRSTLAAELTISHTGSLAGTDQAFQALFDQLGIVRVDSPVEMLETLKFLSVSGAPSGKKIAAFTCSGGDAALLADYCDKVGLQLPQPSKAASTQLTELLPDIATVSNPLDYTTPLWGNTEAMPLVFKALMKDDYDAAIVIQDFPPSHIHDDNTLYRNDARSFMQACNELGIPGAVCSDLPENIDQESREMMIAKNVTPLQGIDSGLDALVNACDYGIRRKAIVASNEEFTFEKINIPDLTGDSRIVDEWSAKQLIKSNGIAIPEGQLCQTIGEAGDAGDEIGYPLVVKAVSPELPHKSEFGAVKINLPDRQSVEAAVVDIERSIRDKSPKLEDYQFLVESMVTDVLAELLIGIKTDSQFGQMLVIASGGVLVEILEDSATLLLPTTREQVLFALESLRIFPLLSGFRGKPACDINQLLDTILSIANFAETRHKTLLEMDINPLMVTRGKTIAADVMIRETDGKL